MGLFDGWFTNTTTNSNKIKTNVPDYITKAGKKVLKRGTDVAFGDFMPYRNELVAPMNDTQNAAVDALTRYVQSQMPGYATGGTTGGTTGGHGPGAGSGTTGGGVVTSAPKAPNYLEKSMGLVDKATNLDFSPATGFISQGAGAPTDPQGRGLVVSGATAPTDPEGRGLVSASANAPSQHVATERVVDEGGKLGKISDYTNPYTEAVLQPTLRNINEQASAQRKLIGDSAASAGAFGDARHGIRDAALGRDTTTAIGDATNTAEKQAFDTAMALRTGDLDRFLNTDITNANFVEQMLGRKMTGGQALINAAEAAANRQLAGGSELISASEAAANRAISGGSALANVLSTKGQLDLAGAGQISNVATADTNRNLALLQSLLTAGGLKQQTAQNKDDAAYREFLRKIQDPYDRTNVGISTLAGTPYQRTVNTVGTTSSPNNDIYALLSAILGGAT